MWSAHCHFFMLPIAWPAFDSLPLVTPSIPLGIAFELALQQ
ncbi:unnamed protein product [Acanthoscelides obtectus]|uniref:Uncharacterized protein n=1 Tax=Acanthoscelides obtectus TaxID=200917 RepID=A0A9P0KUS1_ACAOB|nr:unnamed protein product [Acanthoscelides obtectus]CAK1676310.1 hypothetical protein AOBTE_LOCUS30686 [Acanthoscelides obtectus]